MTAVIILAAFTALVSAVRGMWSPCGLSMLTSLNPVAEAARHHRFAGTAAWYVAGAVAGGALLGGACSLGAWAVASTGLPTVAVQLLVIVAALVTSLSDSRLVRWSLPDHPRQVDERWLGAYRRWIYAGGYGVQIGTGFATYIMTSAVYLTVALAVLTQSPLAALCVGVGFGLARGLTILVAAAADTPGRLRLLLQRVDAREPLSRTVALAVQLFVLVTALGALTGVWVASAALVAAAVAYRVSVRRTSLV